MRLIVIIVHDGVIDLVKRLNRCILSGVKSLLTDTESSRKVMTPQGGICFEVKMENHQNSIIRYKTRHLLITGFRHVEQINHVQQNIPIAASALFELLSFERDICVNRVQLQDNMSLQL